jgi:hypothetical protein
VWCVDMAVPIGMLAFAAALMTILLAGSTGATQRSELASGDA